MTPRELDERVKGYNEEKKEQTLRDMYMAWHIAAFVRSEKMPTWQKIKDDIIGHKLPPLPETKELTFDEKMENIYKMAALIGAEVVEL